MRNVNQLICLCKGSSAILTTTLLAITLQPITVTMAFVWCWVIAISRPVSIVKSGVSYIEQLISLFKFPAVGCTQWTGECMKAEWNRFHLISTVYNGSRACKVSHTYSRWPGASISPSVCVEHMIDWEINKKVIGTKTDLTSKYWYINEYPVLQVCPETPSFPTITKSPSKAKPL